MAIRWSALNSLKYYGPRDRPTRRCGEARGFRTVLGRFGARNRPAGSSRAGCRGLHDGVGRRPMRHREGSEGEPGAPPAVSWGACWPWSLGAAPAPACFFGGAPFASRGSVLATARGGSSDGVLYGRRFQTVTPPLASLTFFSCAKRGCRCTVLHAQSTYSHQITAAALKPTAVAPSERFALRDHA